jgi:sRNA-binding carbon storage regulator CsrA
MLKLDIKPGESVKIGDVAVITLEDKSGKVARLSIQADKSVPITRTAPSTTAQIAAKVWLSADAT